MGNHCNRKFGRHVAAWQTHNEQCDPLGVLLDRTEAFHKMFSIPGPWSNGMTAESHSANRGSIPRGSIRLAACSEPAEGRGSTELAEVSLMAGQRQKWDCCCGGGQVVEMMSVLT